jgi:hypothetical protein
MKLENWWLRGDPLAGEVSGNISDYGSIKHHVEQQAIQRVKPDLSNLRVGVQSVDIRYYQSPEWEVRVEIKDDNWLLSDLDNADYVNSGSDSPTVSTFEKDETKQMKQVRERLTDELKGTVRDDVDVVFQSLSLDSFDSQRNHFQLSFK